MTAKKLYVKVPGTDTVVGIKDLQALVGGAWSNLEFTQSGITSSADGADTIYAVDVDVDVFGIYDDTRLRFDLADGSTATTYSVASTAANASATDGTDYTVGTPYEGLAISVFEDGTGNGLNPDANVSVAMDEVIKVFGPDIVALFQYVAALKQFDGDASKIPAELGTDASSAILALNNKISNLPDELQSKTEIQTLIQQANTALKDELMGDGATELLNTIGEIALLASTNKDGYEALLVNVAGKVSFKEVQTIPEVEQIRATDNIGAARKTTVDAMSSIQEKMLRKYPAPDSMENADVAFDGFTFVTGLLSANAGDNYPSGKAAGESFDKITKTATGNVNITSTNVFSDAETGVLAAVKNDAEIDSFDMGAAFNDAEEATQQSYTPAHGANDNAYVDGVVNHNEFHQKGAAHLKIGAGVLSRYANKFALRHKVNGVDRDTKAVELAYEDAYSKPVVSGLALGVETPVIKNVSGIQFYTTNTVLKLSASIANAINVCHQANPVYVSASPAVLSAFYLQTTDAAVSGLSAIPAEGETITVTDKLLTVTAANQATTDAYLTLSGRNPLGNGDNANTPLQKIMIDTYSDNATDLEQGFGVETRRVPVTTDMTQAAWVAAAKTGLFDSTAEVASGELERTVVNGKIGVRVPQGNYANVLPAQTVNYSSRPVVRSGWAQFMKTPGARSEGYLVIENCPSGAFGKHGVADVSALVAIPGITAELDCGAPSDDLEAMANGAGCQLGGTEYYIEGGIPKARIHFNFKGMNTNGSGGWFGVKVFTSNAAHFFTKFVVNV